MLTIWRLEKERYADSAFRGYGGLETSGRWHHKGTQVAYASEHPGVAVLEKLVWLGGYERARQSRYVLLPLTLDPERHLDVVDESALPDGWDAFPHRDATREIGTRWCEAERSAVLAVPSALLPLARNYLINPFHPDFPDLERGEPVPFSWDARLFQRTRD